MRFWSTHAQRLLLVAIALSACSQGTPPSQLKTTGGGQPCVVANPWEGCSCDGGMTGRQDLDMCTGEHVGECRCPSAMACMIAGASKCKASQKCFGPNDCDLCTCNVAQTVSTVSGKGVPKRMAMAADGSIYVLVSAIPWIVHVPVSGPPVDVGIRGALDWTTEIVIDADQTLLALGTVRTAALPVAQVQRFDTTGNILGMARWDVEDMPKRGTTLSGASAKSDAVVAVATSGQIMQVATISATTTIQSLSKIDFATDPFGTKNSDMRQANTMSLGPVGQIVLAGTHEKFGEGWFALLDAAGQPRSEIFDSSIRFGSRKMVMGSRGLIYQFEDSRDENVIGQSELGSVSRLSDQLESLWWKRLSAGQVINDLVPLDDGVLALASTVENRQSVTPPMAIAERFDTAGNSISMQIPLKGIPLQGIAAGGYDVFVLQRTDGFELTHFKLDPLE